jgi:plastocyanin
MIDRCDLGLPPAAKFTRRAVLGGVLLLSVAAGAQKPAVAAEATVTIDNFTFAPAELTVAVGTTVTWKNHDDIPHSVVERTQKFRSKALDTDDSFSFTFTSAGSYDYFCGLHPHMVGRIIVKP